MPDFPIVSEIDRIILSPASIDSIGPELGSMGYTVTSSTWPAANRAYFVPIRVHAPTTITNMFIVNGTVASGAVDVGIYAENGILIVSSGSTAQVGTTATQTFDIADTLLAPGSYYLAMSQDGTAGTTQRYTPSLALARMLGVVIQAAAFPLPASATFVTSVGNAAPSIFATTRSVV